MAFTVEFSTLLRQKPSIKVFDFLKPKSVFCRPFWGVLWQLSSMILKRHNCVIASLKFRLCCTPRTKT